MVSQFDFEYIGHGAGATAAAACPRSRRDYLCSAEASAAARMQRLCLQGM